MARRPASVMRHLEDDAPEARRRLHEALFRPRFDVAREEHAASVGTEVERQRGVVQRSWRTVGRGVEYRSGAGEAGERRAVVQHPDTRVTLGDADLEAAPRYSLSGAARPPEPRR